MSDAITEKTRVVFAVNLLGNSNKFCEINRLIQNKNIILLEDNCESLGAIYDGKMTGTFGLLSSHSTFFSHHISTMEGGIISTSDEELYHILLSIRAHGWTRNLPHNNRVTGQKNPSTFEESFKFVLPGYNLRPLEMSGAVGIEQLKKLPQFIEDRRKNAKLFVELFGESKKYFIQKEIGESSWFGFSLVVNPKYGLTRRNILQVLDDIGFEYRPIVAGCFTTNPVIKYFDYIEHTDLSNAKFVSDNGFFIGNHHYDISDSLHLLKLSLDSSN